MSFFYFVLGQDNDQIFKNLNYILNTYIFISLFSTIIISKKQFDTQAICNQEVQKAPTRISKS